MLYKTTNRLFRGIYQYKVVLVVPGAGLFRGIDLDYVYSQLKTINIVANNSRSPSHVFWKRSIKTQQDLDYSLALRSRLKKMSGFDIRVEAPIVSVYSNSETDIMALANIDPERVKYVSKPPTTANLEALTIIMPKMDYEYRVTLGKTNQEYSSFIQWANSNKKVKLTKSCIRDLTRDRSWGGTHFYISGDNNLLMAKVHLGSSINKIERIVKA